MLFTKTLALSGYNRVQKKITIVVGKAMNLL